MLFLSATIVLHCFYGLNPLLNIVLNAVLLVLWSVSFALLSWWSSGTLAHVCTRSNWDDETGVSICRTYKALFSFALFALVATVVAVILDVHVQRHANQRGKFAKIQLMDNKFGGRVNVRAVEGEESNPNPSAMGGNRARGGEGYELPEEQFVYDEHMAYSGAGGQFSRRSVEERM